MAAVQRLVAYERVSTARQGLSGLGLEAQRRAIGDFATARGAEVLEEDHCAAGLVISAIKKGVPPCCQLQMF